MMNQLINWYKTRHPDIADVIDNTPQRIESKNALQQLASDILLPIQHQFGEVIITYGFTSLALKNYIQKHSPKQTAPELDQHAACELNKRNKPICSRLGAACDIKVQGYEQSMDVIAKYVAKYLPYDRMYFYSPKNALHISIGLENNRLAQIMKLSEKGHFVPCKNARADKAVQLFDNEF